MTLGGGLAMATVMRHELVLKRQWLNDDDFMAEMSLATLVPGAIAVNVAYLQGRHLRGEDRGGDGGVRHRSASVWPNSPSGLGGATLLQPSLGGGFFCGAVRSPWAGNWPLRASFLAAAICATGEMV